MTKISSELTFFYKKAFPVAWFGFLAFFFVVVLVAGAGSKDPIFLIVPVVMASHSFAVRLRRARSVKT